DLEVVAADLGHRLGQPAVRTDLDHTLDRSVEGLPGGEHGPFAAQPPHVELLGGTHPHGAAVRVDRGDVPGPAVRTRPGDPEPLALADGEPVHTVVLGELGAAGVDDRTAPHPDPGAQERPGVAGRDEADVVAVRLVGDREAAAG